MVVVLLDAGPLGLVSNPRMSPGAEACRQWLESLVQNRVLVLVPEIADYEVRRELLRAGKHLGIQRLDTVAVAVGSLPLTTAAMRRAAKFWAEARQRGRPTADARALDADVILAAQAVVLAEDTPDVVIATTNPRHLDQFVPARRWQDIVP